MENFSLSYDKLQILNQYKEILNESDDDIARATLESLDWDLNKAIDASTGTNNAQDMDDDIEIINTVKPVEIDAIGEEDMSMDSSSGLNAFESISRVFSKTEDPTMSCSSSVNGIKMQSTQSSRDFSSAAVSDNNGSNSIADNLSISSMDYFSSAAASTTNCVKGKNSPNRDDSGSGSTCSLANNIQPSTSNEPVIRNIPVRAIKSFESEDESDDNIDYNYQDTSDDDEIKEQPNSVKSFKSEFTDQVPLIPTDFSSIYEAMQNFNTVFEARQILLIKIEIINHFRYGINFALFYQGSLSEAISEAFEGRPIMERRPLVLYLHNDSSVAANIFAQNVMCSEAVSSLLKCQFILWAWDMSQQENRQKFYTWMTLSMSNIADSIKLIHKTKYPLLVVLVKERGTVSIHLIIKGYDSAEQTIGKLMSGLDYYLRVKNKDSADDLSRLERAQILQEQAAEYEEALAIDRARQREIQEQKDRKREQVAEELKIAEEKREKQSKLAALLPTEPEESELSVTIRIRFPTGEQKIRRFRTNEQLRWLIILVESLGYDMDTHRIWTSDVPKKNIATFDEGKTFDELNWPRREQVTVEEK